MNKCLICFDHSSNYGSIHMYTCVFFTFVDLSYTKLLFLRYAVRLLNTSEGLTIVRREIKPFIESKSAIHYSWICKNVRLFTRKPNCLKEIILFLSLVWTFHLIGLINIYRGLKYTINESEWINIRFRFY